MLPHTHSKRKKYTHMLFIIIGLRLFFPPCHKDLFLHTHTRKKNRIKFNPIYFIYASCVFHPACVRARQESGRVYLVVYNYLMMITHTQCLC